MIPMTGFNRMLKHTVDIYQPTRPNNVVTGETSEEYPDMTYQSIPCLIQSLTGAQVLEYAGLGIKADYTGFFKGTQDINLRDKIVWQEKNLFVIFIDKEQGGDIHHKEVTLRLEEETDVAL